MTELFAEIEREPRRRVGRDAPWTRRVVLGVFALLIAAVLAGATGQTPHDSSAAAPAARISLSAPDTVRGGLLVQARVEIHARRTIAQPQLVLQRGWLEGLQYSSIEPQPTGEFGAGDGVGLAWSRLDAGKTLVVWFQLQVDPTNVGRRPAGVRLQDGTRTLATISHTLTVLP